MTGLNHLAQAARAVLANSAQTNQMVLDLGKVDFAAIRAQASWACQEEERKVCALSVAEMEAELKKTIAEKKQLGEFLHASFVICNQSFAINHLQSISKSSLAR